jgi:NitT/TauT family transport system substrate-binding protein
MAETIEKTPEVVQCFVDGSIKGWYNYLYGDSSAADALIKTDNPDMTQDKIEFAKASMLKNGIVDSGDALELGIGAMTDAKIEDFYNKMVGAGVLEDGLDWKSAYTLEFTNKKVGMDLK